MLTPAAFAAGVFRWWEGGKIFSFLVVGFRLKGFTGSAFHAPLRDSSVLPFQFPLPVRGCPRISPPALAGTNEVRRYFRPAML
jgi:hypothetical protein